MRDVPTLRRPASAATERDDLASRRMIVNSHRYRTRFECPTSTRFGHPTLSREWRRMTAKQPFRVAHISLAFDVRFAALNAHRNQFSNAVAACELVL